MGAAAPANITRYFMIKHDKRGFLLALPFFVVLGALTVVSFLLPLRPAFSESEKRELTHFPDFSLEALVSGDYFDDITLWFSDTFPGREGWISLSQQAANFHGYSEIAIEGPLVLSDTVVVEPEPPEEAAVLPQETEGEKSAEETGTTEATEEAGWGGVDAANAEIDLGAAIQIGDAGFNQLGFNQGQSNRYIDTLNRFAKTMASHGITVVSAPCPTSVGIMVEEEYLPMLGCAPQDEIIAYLHENMDDSIVKVNAFPNLIAHNDAYVYFRTDHHWTALGAYYAYQALCQTLGHEAADLEEDFELWNQGDFKGTLYGKVRWPAKLRIDTLDTYVPKGNITMYAHFKNNKNKAQYPIVSDWSNKNPTGKYSAFLGSDCPMVEIINEDLPEDAPSCMVVKDSFGNCYVPFLSKTYRRVYAIDYRKFGIMQLSYMCSNYDIDDVIVMPYIIATQSIQGNDLFLKQLK